MAELKDVIAYILRKYPPGLKWDLSKARITKMIYLADWHQAICHDHQITNIKWYFDNYGPYVNDVKLEAERHPDLFDVSLTSNMYGQPKEVISLTNQAYEPAIDAKAKASIDHVISETHKMYWDDFIKLVYSTHPIFSSNRYTDLDLIAKAREYKNMSLTG